MDAESYEGNGEVLKEWSGSLNEFHTYQLERWCRPEQALLFDIETTGFSPNRSMLYLIGFCRFQANGWSYRMLFNDDGRSEYALLDTFLSLLQPDTVLVHFNGNGFDLPYLSEKCRQYQTLGLPLSDAERLSDCRSIDLYQCIQPFRKGLPLPNLKLQTIEAALGISRTDTASGGDLIRVYRTYLKTGDSRLEQQLYQHNFDDILGMIPLLRLLGYQAVTDHLWELDAPAETEDALLLPLRLPLPLPVPYTGASPYYALELSGAAGLCRIPIRADELRYYLPDWKNYYYLPAEDTVVHKSVAAYVDAAYKERATKKNAFLKKRSRFLPYLQQAAADGIRLYREAEHTKIVYADLTELPQDNAFWSGYLQQILG